MAPRQLLRLCVSTLIVVVPASYVLWQWAYDLEPALSGLSYASVDKQLSSAEHPVFWTYSIWLLCVFVVLTLLTRLVDWLLLTIYPNQPKR